MEKTAVFHLPESVWCHPVEKDVLSVRLQTKADDVESVWIIYQNLYDHSENRETVRMDKILSDGLHDYFESRIRVRERHFKYYFRIMSSEGEIAYCADGFLKVPKENNFFYYPFINPDDLPDLPDWAEGGIIYQLLVDRFRDGNPANNPSMVRAWNEKPDRDTYYGGDFEGIVDRLDYLESLGVSSVYLSPVFRSPSYHKYDTMDYDLVEAVYGGAEGLKRLADALHARKMKLILDGVFNHCSCQHPFFQDLLRNQNASPYADWFEPYGFPVSVEKGNYNNFANLVPKMPRWNTHRPEVIEYLSEIALRWTKELGVDGWRLDVADEVSSDFWREFRRKLKAENSEILIIGEIWSLAERWTRGDQLDTITNYKFRQILIDFVKGSISSRMWAERIQANKSHYKTSLFPYLVNLVGTHDTERALRAFGSRENHFLAMALMLCFEGIPLIYYGDECGMDGGADPDNRRAMNWTLCQSPEAETLRHLGMFRKASPVLRKGSTTHVPSEDRVVIFDRISADGTLRCAFNFGTRASSIGPGNRIMGNPALQNEEWILAPGSFALLEPWQPYRTTGIRQ